VMHIDCRLLDVYKAQGGPDAPTTPDAAEIGSHPEVARTWRRRARAASLVEIRPSKSDQRLFAGAVFADETQTLGAPAAFCPFRPGGFKRRWIQCSVWQPGSPTFNIKTRTPCGTPQKSECVLKLRDVRSRLERSTRRFDVIERPHPPAMTRRTGRFARASRLHSSSGSETEQPGFVVVLAAGSATTRSG